MEGKVPSHLNSVIANPDKTIDLVALIEKCDDVNRLDALGNSPLSVALTCKCSLKVIRALVEKGANVDAPENNLKHTPLHVAFYVYAKKNVILYLLRYAVNVNVIDLHQRTLLHLAFEKARDHGIWRALITKGANLEALDDTGRTPLHVAIDCGTNLGPYLIPCLLKKTKNVNSTDSRLPQRTLLHAAIEGRCKYEIIRTLVDKGANVNAQDGEGLTPLHTAFNCSYSPHYHYKPNQYEQDQLDLYSFFIENTSDINARDKNNRTPLYYAFLRSHNPALIRELVENGADFNCPDGSVFRLATDEERLPLLTKTFPEELKDLKTIVVSQKTTLYDALVLGRPHDWNCVDRPLECLTERNRPFWSVILSSIVAQRSFSFRLESEGIRLDEDSTLHVLSFLQNYDVINLLLAYSKAKVWCSHCLQAFLHLKRRSDSPLSPTIKRQKKNVKFDC